MSSPIPLTSTGPYAGPEMPLEPEEIILLGGCVYDITGVAVTSALSPGLTTNGSTDSTFAPSPAFVSAAIGQAMDTVSRWQRLAAAAQFIIRITERLTDEHLYAVIRAVGLEGDPTVTALLARAETHGGLSAHMHARVPGCTNLFNAELNRAVAIFQYLVTLPGGFLATGAPGVVASPTNEDHHTAGCIAGAVITGLGAYAIGHATAIAVGSGGTLSPIAGIEAVGGAALVTGGLGMIDHHCFADT